MDKDIQDYIDKLKEEMRIHIEKIYWNATEIGRIQQQQTNDEKEWVRNWTQHTEFYSKLDTVESENDRVAGGIKVLGAIMVPVVVSVIIALIKSFWG